MMTNAWNKNVMALSKRGAIGNLTLPGSAKWAKLVQSSILYQGQNTRGERQKTNEANPNVNNLALHFCLPWQAVRKADATCDLRGDFSGHHKQLW